MNNPASHNITILHDTKEWSTDLDGNISEVKINGNRLNDIHDVALKIDRMTTFIKALALTATVVAVAEISAIGYWIASNPTVEDKQLKSSNQIMGRKLKSVGWVWKDGGWQQIGNNALNPSK